MTTFDVDALTRAYLLDGTGGGTVLEWKDVSAWSPEQGALWAHLLRDHEDTARWLETEAGLAPLVREALLAEETRPRSVPTQGGLLVILRGVNLNPGADPEDMVSIRMWVDTHRVISVSQKRLMAVADLVESIETGRGPQTSAEFLVRLADHLVDRMEPVIEELDTRIDAVEDAILEGHVPELRTSLAALRRQCITLRRYLAPQREAMTRLQGETAVLSEASRMQLRESTDRITRFVEDLDAARDRAAVITEELAGRVSETMNRNMYLLSIVAAIFLPLGLVTGLLGINVGGIPLADDSAGFVYVTLGLIALGLGLTWLARRMQLL